MRSILSLQSHLSFDALHVDAMAQAFSAVLDELGPVGRTAFAREVVSNAIIAAALAGERDADSLRLVGLQGFRDRRGPAELTGRDSTTRRARGELGAASVAGPLAGHRIAMTGAASAPAGAPGAAPPPPKEREKPFP